MNRRERLDSLCDPLDKVHEVHITAKSISFPVLMDGGFGAVVVKLEPGQQETVTINGHVITVVRDYVN